MLESINYQSLVLQLLNGGDYTTKVDDMVETVYTKYLDILIRGIGRKKLAEVPVTELDYREELYNAYLSNIPVIGGEEKFLVHMNNLKKDDLLDRYPLGLDHYRNFESMLETLLNKSVDKDKRITIHAGSIGIILSLNDALILMGAIAVKRVVLYAKIWLVASMQVEHILLRVLCKLFEVPKQFYGMSQSSNERIAVKFYLFCNPNQEKYRCEVKLMGNGNPESADAVIARDSRVFVADKLSDLNKHQLDKLGVEWVELRAENGYKRFGTVLENLGIPYQAFDGDLDERLQQIFDEEFSVN